MTTQAAAAVKALPRLIGRAAYWTGYIATLVVGFIGFSDLCIDSTCCLP